jgi:DNA helicase-2/ATP-dependent DNA helicase PcrA
LGPVVDCYKKIIKGAPSVVDGFLEAIVAHRTQGGPEIGMWTCESDMAEATRVAEELDERTRKAIYPLNSSTTYAIIVRTNRQMRVFEEELSQAGIAYMIVGASSFFNRPEVSTVMAYLRVLEDPCDDDAMEQVVLGKSKLTKYLGKAYAKELRAYAGKRGMLSVMDETGKPWQRQKGREIQQFFEKIEHEYGNLGVADQLRAIVAQAGIMPALTDAEDFDEIDNSIEENIEELIRAAQGYVDRADFIHYADQLCRRPSKADVPVKILTVHRAKGREFDVVYLCGFNDDLIPHKRAEDIEEERRIAYVAISRAKDELVISSYGQPSRFLKYLEAEELP